MLLTMSCEPGMLPGRLVPLREVLELNADLYGHVIGSWALAW